VGLLGVASPFHGQFGGALNIAYGILVTVVLLNSKYAAEFA
jgi:hypothetical protein